MGARAVTIAIIIGFLVFFVAWIGLTRKYEMPKEDREYYRQQFWTFWGHYLLWAIPWVVYCILEWV